MARKERQLRSQELRTHKHQGDALRLGMNWTEEDLSKWLDVSVPIYAGMVYFPDNPSIEIDTLTHVERGDVCTLSALRMGTHTGTHIDAPIHFLPGGSGVEEVPLDHLMGPARVIEIKDPDAVKV